MLTELTLIPSFSQQNSEFSSKQPNEIELEEIEVAPLPKLR